MVGADRGVYGVYNAKSNVYAMSEKESERPSSKQDDLYTHTMKVNEDSGNAYSRTVHKQTFHELSPLDLGTSTVVLYEGGSLERVGWIQV